MRAGMTFWAAVGVASNFVLAAVLIILVLLVVPPSVVAWRDPGYLGGALGVLGGLIGISASILNAKGPRERAFLVKWSWVAWSVMMPFMGIMLASSPPYRLYLFIPLGIFIWLGGHHQRRTQRRIRQEESQGQGTA